MHNAGHLSRHANKPEVVEHANGIKGDSRMPLSRVSLLVSRIPRAQVSGWLCSCGVVCSGVESRYSISWIPLDTLLKPFELRVKKHLLKKF